VRWYADCLRLLIIAAPISLTVTAQNLFSLVPRGETRQAHAAEALALAEREVAGRQLVLTVAQDYYNVTAEQGSATARTAYDDGLLRYHVALANLQTLTGNL
jgi:hypothetical protein